MCPKPLVLQESFRKVTNAVKQTYQEMQELLVRNMERTLQNLESANSRFSRDCLVQVCQLHERQEDIKQMLASVQMALNKAQNINFMKVPGLGNLNLSLPRRSSPPCVSRVTV